MASKKKAKSKSPKRTKKLTEEQKAALILVKDGGDVTSYTLAKRLREIEQRFPEFITIGRVMGAYPTGFGHQEPYFGAIATAAGLRAARS